MDVSACAYVTDGRDKWPPNSSLAEVYKPSPPFRNSVTHSHKHRLAKKKDQGKLKHDNTPAFQFSDSAPCHRFTLSYQKLSSFYAHFCCIWSESVHSQHPVVFCVFFSPLHLFRLQGHSFENIFSNKLFTVVTMTALLINRCQSLRHSWWLIYLSDWEHTVIALINELEHPAWRRGTRVWDFIIVTDKLWHF